MEYYEDTLDEFFDISRGVNGITEEFVYNNPGNLSIISATSTNLVIFGKVDRTLFKNKILKDVIAIVRVGKAGKTFLIQDECILTENVLYLKVKDKYKDSINIKWFSHYIKNDLLNNAKGDRDGQQSISKEIIERIKVKIPKEVLYQNKIAKKYKDVEKNLDVINSKIKNIIEFLNFKIESKHESTEIISNVFDIQGGNGELTEEFLYNNSLVDGDEYVPVYSGSIINSKPFYIDSKKCDLSKFNTYRGPAILVCRKGKAGFMKYLSDEIFLINDDAYVMTLKDEWKNKIDLHWFVNNYQNLFFNIVTSKSDNATFNKQYAEKQHIKIPDYKKSQKIIGDKIILLRNKLSKLFYLRNKLNELLDAGLEI